MLNKLISMCLAVTIFTVASSVNVFTQTAAVDENPPVVVQEKEAPKSDLQSAVRAQNNSDKLNISNKSTLAEYERQKKQSKGMSTTTKVLIGVGIAAGVLAIVAFAASRDKIRTF